LHIPADFQVINVIPLGYSSQEIQEHAEEEYMLEKIHSEKW
jgi:hypothetical protein